MAVDIPEAEEFTFTLVSNKKHKEKSKVFSLPSMSSSDSKNKTSLISWAFPLPKAVTAHPASKLVITHYGSAITVTPSPSITISKFIKLQIAPSPALLTSKSFAQIAKANITQQALRFAPASSYENFLCLSQLKEVFSNLSQATIISMHQTSLGSTGAS